MTGEPMSDAEIREALSRAERATSGPWEITAGGGHKAPSICCPESYHACGVNVVQADRSVISSVSYTNEVCEFPMQDVMGTPEAKAVAEFIAHARTDVPRLAADLLAARAERDLALSLRNTATNVLADVVAHRDSLAARCAALEAERAIVADYLRDTDADFRARRPSERAVLDALLSPPPPHTCQIHRATSGASDCGLEPCEEAKAHTDRGASRPTETATPEDEKVCDTCHGEPATDCGCAPEYCSPENHACPDCGGGA